MPDSTPARQAQALIGVLSAAMANEDAAPSTAAVLDVLAVTSPVSVGIM